MNSQLLIVTLLSFVLAIHSKLDRPRGVARSKVAFYVAGGDFTCLDGSLKVPFDHVNDDYCDCLDASDEPGTSACPNGSFHCTNAGHKPLNIPSSRVNDGLCDCCDGTDEYNSRTRCDNTCREMGRAAREEAERVKKLIEEGFEIQKEYCQLGNDAKQQNQARLADLEKHKSEAEERKKELQALKEEAEIPEKEAKEAHEKMKAEEKARLEELKSGLDSDGAFQELDSNGDAFVSVDEMQTHIEFDIDVSGEVSQEEAKEYLEDKDAVDLDTFKDLIWPNVKAIYKKPEGSSVNQDEATGESDETSTERPVSDEDDASDYDYDREDDEDYYDDEMHGDGGDDNDEEEDIHDDDSVKDTDNSDAGVVMEYDENTKILIAAADKARADYSEAEKQFKDAERELTDVNNFLSMDLGPENVFFPIKGNCYEFTDREYTYKFCPYDKATQRSKNGGSETSLGKWGRWAGPEDNIYSSMLLENGQNCWNGPNRSAKVHFKCGLNNELVAASEPNRCEYEYQFLTPAACNEAMKNAAVKDPARDEL